MALYSNSARARKSAPQHPIDPLAADLLAATFPRATSATNQRVVEQVAALIGHGALPMTEILLEASERTGGMGWLTSRLQRYGTINAAQIRALIDGRRAA